VSIYRNSIPTVIIAAAMLASCGGGGNGGPNPPPPPPNLAALPITGDNAQDIAAAVLDAATSVAELVSVIDFIGIPTVASSDGGLAKPAFAEIVFAETVTDVVACDVGEITRTWDDSDNSSTMSTGDTFDIVFGDCFTGASATTIDGAVSLTNLVITGDPVNVIAPWGLASTVGLTDLAITDADGTVTVNGDLGFDSSSDDNIVVTGAVDSTLVTIQFSSGVNEELAGYMMAQTSDMNALTSSIDTSGTFTSTVLEGSVTFETLQSFVAVSDANPSAGEMLISDDTSSVLVTVIDNVNIQLEIDFDLDGVINRTIVVGWVDLDL
jgi:hypothetical protein